MNAESFANLLKEYAHLYQLPMEELRTMVMQYPYCHNLQVLLQEKAELDQHPDREKTLAKAATYAIDRKQLFKRLKLMREQRIKPKAEAYHLGEDFSNSKIYPSFKPIWKKLPWGFIKILPPAKPWPSTRNPLPPLMLNPKPNPASIPPGMVPGMGLVVTTWTKTELENSFEDVYL